jgi:hypothetical protein
MRIMALKIDKQWHLLAAIAGVIVVGLQVGRLRDLPALASGTKTVMGTISDIQATTRIRIVHYEYKVDGTSYTGEATDRTRFMEGLPVQVTYAPAKPWISSIEPEKVQSVYVTSIVVAICGVLPMLIMWLMELLHKFKRTSA